MKAGPSLAKLVLDVPFAAEAVLRLAFSRYDVVHAVEESAHLVAPFARLLGVPLVMDVDSSIPDQLRYSGFATRGPLLWLADALERHALRHSVAAVTVCQSLTDGVKRRAPGRAGVPGRGPAARGRAAAAGGRARSRRSAASWASARVRSSSTRATSSPTRASSCCSRRCRSSRARSSCSWVDEPPRSSASRPAPASSGRDGACSSRARGRPPSSPAFLALADVLCSPRVKGENTPFKIYSYLASGKPIVATRIATPHAAPRRLARVPRPAHGRGPRGRGRSRALRDPNEARARAAPRPRADRPRVQRGALPGEGRARLRRGRAADARAR